MPSGRLYITTFFSCIGVTVVSIVLYGMFSGFIGLMLYLAVNGKNKNRKRLEGFSPYAWVGGAITFAGTVLMFYVDK